MPRVRELIEAKIHDLGSRLSGYRITASETGLNIGCAPAITASSTNSISRRTFCIWSRSVFAARSIAERDHGHLS